MQSFTIMNFLKKILGKADDVTPTEPIFPKENFSIFQLNMPDGFAIATVNTAYKNYQNKKCYPFLVGIELEVLEKNSNGHPGDIEGQRLNEIQTDFEELLKQQQTVHSVARVTRDGARDIMIYIEKPVFSEKAVTDFCNNIRKERKMLLSVQRDESWKSVSIFFNSDKVVGKPGL